MSQEVIDLESIDEVFSTGQFRVYRVEQFHGSDSCYLKSNIQLNPGTVVPVKKIDHNSLVGFLKDNKASVLADEISKVVSKTKKCGNSDSCFEIDMPTLIKFNCLDALSGGYKVDNDLLFCFVSDLAQLPLKSDAEYEKFASHQLVFTNPGTGKTSIASRSGYVIESSTVAGLLGFSTADTWSRGELDGKEGVVTLDELSGLSSSNMYSYLFSLMENGHTVIVKGCKANRVNSRVSLRFMGNPQESHVRHNEITKNDDVVSNKTPAEQFESLLQRISTNSSAFGRRIGLIFVFDRVSTSKQTTSDFDSNISSLQLMAFKKQKTDQFISAIKTNSKWLETPYPESYLKSIDALIKSKDFSATHALVVPFLEGHKESFKHARGIALRNSIVLNQDKEKVFKCLLDINLTSFGYIVKGLASSSSYVDYQLGIYRSLPIEVRAFLNVIAKNSNVFENSVSKEYSDFTEFDCCHSTKRSRQQWFEFYIDRNKTKLALFGLSFDFLSETLKITLDKAYSAMLKTIVEKDNVQTNLVEKKKDEKIDEKRIKINLRDALK